MDYLKPFEERRKENIAEKILVDKYKDDDNVLIIKYGLDLLHVDMPMDMFCKIPTTIRKTPDYIMIHRDSGTPYFVEAKGCKIYLKLKLEDLESYYRWNRTMGTDMTLLLFVYDSNTKTDTFVSLAKINLLIKRHGYTKKKFFDNNKEYYEIPYSHIQR
jgi:hypothetical protein